MRDDKLDAALDSELSSFASQKRVKVDAIVEGYFEKIDYCYQVQKYPFEVIYGGFKKAGLIGCSFNYFRNRYYQIRKVKASLGSIEDKSIDLKEVPDAELSSVKERSLGVSSQANISLEGLLESMFGASEHVDKNNEEGGNKGEDISSSPPAQPSLLTEEMASRLIQNKKLFDERIRSMGIVRE